MQRDFKGIWIPKDIWLAENLTVMEKLFLVEIDSLDNEKGCFASNAYFAEFFELSLVRVSQVINSLKEKNYITTEINQAEGNTRILRTLLKKSLRPSTTKVCDPLKEKFKTPLKEKFKHNNTVVNNTNNNEDGGATALSIYREFYPNYRLSIYQETLLESAEVLPDKFREALHFWAARNYRESSIDKILHCYKTESYKSDTKPQPRNDSGLYVRHEDFMEQIRLQELNFNLPEHLDVGGKQNV